MWDYYSELSPDTFYCSYGFGDYYYESKIMELKDLSMEELLNEYNSCLKRLEEMRKNEPVKKRKKGVKDKYRYWIMNTHNLRNYLNEVAQEIRKRNLGSD